MQTHRIVGAQGGEHLQVAPAGSEIVLAVHLDKVHRRASFEEVAVVAVAQADAGSQVGLAGGHGLALVSGVRSSGRAAYFFIGADILPPICSHVPLATSFQSSALRSTLLWPAQEWVPAPLAQSFCPALETP